MQIKTVHYERLFTLGNYQNEKIGFSADLHKHDNAEAVLGQLFGKVTESEHFLCIFRNAIDEEESMSQRIDRQKCRVANSEQQIQQMKISMTELAEKLQKGTGDVDDHLRHACSGTSLKGLTAQLNLERQQLRGLLAHEEKLTEFILEINSRIGTGNFSAIGLSIPRLKPSFED